MALVLLPSSLLPLAGGAEEVEVTGDTVFSVLRRLETENPRLCGWVLDEQGRLRTHVALFVNGERAVLATPVEPADRVHVVPAISGGAV